MLIDKKKGGVAVYSFKRKKEKKERRHVVDLLLAVP